MCYNTKKFQMVTDMETKKFPDVTFVRKFSACLFKDRKLMLGEMDFSKDVKRSDRGDKYPVLTTVGEIGEDVKNGEYVFRSNGGSVTRLIGHLSPYATYEAVLSELDGECGFAFLHGEDKAVVTLKKDEEGLAVHCGAQNVDLGADFRPGMSFCVLPRKNKFDVYIKTDAFPVCVGTFEVPGFEKAAEEDFFMRTSAGLYCTGNVRVNRVSFYMDSGVSLADVRTVRYENGDVIRENGRIFLTASVRLEEGAYQGVFSWIPGTEEFKLTGALFFDAGDGEWANDVATSLIFDRQAKQWILWVCSFSHGHVLARAAFDGEPRFGKNVIDVELLPMLGEKDDDTVFGGKPGDEDPDLIYDAGNDRWLLAVCRISSEGGYRYHFFASDSPLDGFSYVGQGVKGAETGGSFFRYGGKLYFVCGNSFDARSDYRVYEWDDLPHPGKLVFDYPDGGFRGWGTVFTVKQGTREKLYHLTFDRTLGSKSGYNWSYGNIYCFEGYLN